MVGQGGVFTRNLYRLINARSFVNVNEQGSSYMKSKISIALTEVKALHDFWPNHIEIFSWAKGCLETALKCFG